MKWNYIFPPTEKVNLVKKKINKFIKKVSDFKLVGLTICKIISTLS